MLMNYSELLSLLLDCVKIIWNFFPPVRLWDVLLSDFGALRPFFELHGTKFGPPKL